MANIYVNHTGSSTPPYDTEAKAERHIQHALDYAVEGDTVWIKADQDYVMNGTDQQAAQFDVDKNDGITIKGYYLSPGDQDYGGTYYKDPNHGWVVINANNGAFSVFSIGDFNKFYWHNLKTINVNTSYTTYCFSASPGEYYYGYLLQNCWVTGGCNGVICDGVHSLIVRDCKFTGTYSGDAVICAIDAVTPGSLVVEFCEFAHSNASRSILVSYEISIIHNNIFNISGTVSKIIDGFNGGVIFNNIVYEGSGGNIATGIYLGTIEEHTLHTAIYNNIIAGCTTSINEPVPIAFGGWNCFYNNGSNWTLRNGDIVANPQFMDAANGDFRLKPTSPCSNAGKPTLGGGYTDIGVWQRKSLLRWK